MFKLKPVFFVLLMFAIGSCTTDQIQKKEQSLIEKHADFLEKNEASPELFRVLISSDGYELSQMKSEQTIRRAEDKGGDRYISGEVARFNMIDEMREAVFAVQIRPDNGTLSKIRPQRSTSLAEIDRILIEDIQRWTFRFPQKRVTPTHFNIRYRIVLQKTMTDSQIMEEVQRRAKERRR